MGFTTYIISSYRRILLKKSSRRQFHSQKFDLIKGVIFSFPIVIDEKKMRLLLSPSSSSASSGSESDSSTQIRIGRIKKASHEQRQRYQLMNRLRTMVPNARSATTQLELLQYIIDYISDLQVGNFNLLLFSQNSYEKIMLK